MSMLWLCNRTLSWLRTVHIRFRLLHAINKRNKQLCAGRKQFVRDVSHAGNSAQASLPAQDFPNCGTHVSILIHYKYEERYNSNEHCLGEYIGRANGQKRILYQNKIVMFSYRTQWTSNDCCYILGYRWWTRACWLHWAAHATCDITFDSSADWAFKVGGWHSLIEKDNVLLQTSLK